MFLLMFAVSFAALCCATFLSPAPKTSPVQGAEITQSVYVLRVSEESKALFRFMKMEPPAAKYVLKSNGTFVYERLQNMEKLATEGTFMVNQKDVILSSQEGAASMAQRGQLAEDRLVIDGLIFLKVTDNISGLWTRQTAAGPDKSIRFRFNDKGRFWFSQGDPKAKDAIGSEGMYKVDGDTILLFYLKIDGEDAPASMPPGKLSLAGDRTSFLDARGQRYERTAEL
jgi:hypothetical protein